MLLLILPAIRRKQTSDHGQPDVLPMLGLVDLKPFLESVNINF
jgi:hypothetical protein